MSETDLRHLVEARRAYAPAISPDGRLLAFVSDLTGYPEAYLHEGPGREPHALTEYRERVSRLVWSRDGRRLMLDTDLGGDEKWAIRSVRPDGHGHRALSVNPSVMHVMGEISPDDRWLSCSTNARDPAVFDLGLIDTDNGIERTLLAGDGSDMPGVFSPDGRFVLGSRMYGSFRQELFLVPSDGGEPLSLTPEGEWVRHQYATFEPSGESLLMLTDRGRDFLGLFRLSLETREWTSLYAPDDRDVEIMALSRDGSTALLAENVRGYSRLLVYLVETGEARPLDHRLGVVTHLSICDDGTRGAFTLAHAGSPPEIYLADLTTGVAERATRSSSNEDLGADLVHPEEVRFTSFDGTEIPGWLYLPPGHSGPRPTVVKVHGGPEGQARPVFDPVVQYLLSRGFAVYEPNVRGSTGYGRAYAALDDKRLRFDAVKDLAESAHFLSGLDRIDEDRISLLGGSYGGFMVLAGLAFFPELWSAGVSIVGIANFKTFLANTGAYRRSWRVVEYGDPETDGDFLDEISPVYHAHEIRAPLLVIHGANDPRVPQDEAEQIVHAVGRTGGVAQYLLFRDEGHGIVKLPNRLKANAAVVKFLEEHGA